MRSVTGTEITKAAVWMTLLDDNFATLVAAVRKGRNAFDHIRHFPRYLLSSNMGEVLMVRFGVVGLRAGPGALPRARSTFGYGAMWRRSVW